jgi:hypothetical protein
VAGGNNWTARFPAIVLAVCVRFVFGVAAASHNTRFQAARYGLTGPDVHRLIASALAGRLQLFHPSHSMFAAGAISHGLSRVAKSPERRQ